MSEAPTLDTGVLLECVVTSTNADGSTNVAPMGPIVAPDFTRVLLRPFSDSTTYANLTRERRAVLNVTDDVELIARAALNLFDEPPALEHVSDRGRRIADGCRWYALEVESIDASEPRVEVVCRVGESGTERDFLGFNRASHAVIEATILATRLHLIDHAEVLAQTERLAPLVEKTGGPCQRRAFALVQQFITARCQ